MGAFEQTWLQLREPYDHAARSGVLAAKFARAVGAAPVLIDLGCGTGSNLRYLSPRLGRNQTWIGFDHDARLLDAAAAAVARWGEARGLAPERSARSLRLRGSHADLDVLLIERDLADARRAFSLDGAHGITAAAILDLVSAAWLDKLAHRIKMAAMPALFALSYDGRIEWWPQAGEDAAIRARFDAHQRTDKGFGPALGPDAAAYLAARLERDGFRVRLARSDWRLDAADHRLLAAFLEGFVAAARAIADDAQLRDWAAGRGDELARGRLRLTVGHVDLLALPPAGASEPAIRGG